MAQLHLRHSSFVLPPWRPPRNRSSWVQISKIPSEQNSSETQLKKHNLISSEKLGQLFCSLSFPVFNMIFRTTQTQLRGSAVDFTPQVTFLSWFLGEVASDFSVFFFFFHMLFQRPPPPVERQARLGKRRCELDHSNLKLTKRAQRSAKSWTQNSLKSPIFLMAMGYGVYQEWWRRQFKSRQARQAILLSLNLRRNRPRHGMALPGPSTNFGWPCV